MKIMKRFIALALLPLLMAADDYPLHGGPTTFSTPSPNGQFLFVMIAPRSATHETEKAQHQKDLLAKYPTSGLYRNDGSTSPIYTVDWYSYRVWPADDGVHLVRLHGDFPLSERYPASKRLPDETVAEQVNAPGLSFYAAGKLQKIYMVRELVKNVETLPHSLQHVLWSADGILTKDGRQFCMMTQDSRQIFFDLETGSVAVDRAAGLGNDTQVWVVRLSLAITGLAGAIILGGWLYRQAKSPR